MQRKFWAVVIIIGSITAIGGYYLYSRHKVEQPASTESSTVSEAEPEVTVETVAKNVQKPWDISFLPNGTPIFTENDGTVSIIRNSKVQLFAEIAEVNPVGEGGLTGLAVDPEFAENKTIYLCYNTTEDVRVVAWRVNESETCMEKKASIVTGIPSNVSGRHSGCRLAFGTDGYLWIGTGDAAQATNPQDPKSLGGKILRVQKDGSPANGNIGREYDSRIYSYGHRNTQGLAFSKNPVNEVIGYSVEHGSSIDDEVNPLTKGNFGWDPQTPYDENGVSMTDLQKFPDAIEATWTSGSRTQAPSGAGFIYGKEWKSWDGALAVAVLKDKHLKVFTVDDNGSIQKEFRILDTYGRLRDVEQAPDGSLYVTTDNGGDTDVVLKVTAN